MAGVPPWLSCDLVPSQRTASGPALPAGALGPTLHRGSAAAMAGHVPRGRGSVLESPQSAPMRIPPRSVAPGAVGAATGGRMGGGVPWGCGRQSCLRGGRQGAGPGPMLGAAWPFAEPRVGLAAVQGGRRLGALGSASPGGSRWRVGAGVAGGASGPALGDHPLPAGPRSRRARPRGQPAAALPAPYRGAGAAELPPRPAGSARGGLSDPCGPRAAAAAEGRDCPVGCGRTAGAGRGAPGRRGRRGAPAPPGGAAGTDRLPTGGMPGPARPRPAAVRRTRPPPAPAAWGEAGSSTGPGVVWASHGTRPWGAGPPAGRGRLPWLRGAPGHPWSGAPPPSVSRGSRARRQSPWKPAG